MNPVEIPIEARRARPDCRVVSMGPPPGVPDEECGTAEMLVSGEEEQMTGFVARRFYAYFRPTEAELAKLNAGGFIELAQYGHVVQPFGCAIWDAIPGAENVR
ncbi:hypothetical protein [Nocardioides sp.]|uniref:hypothetical protein n=1 Tax=Nocardioides sp. TaxID=35761 RepID=UPI0035AFE4F4